MSSPTNRRRTNEFNNYYDQIWKEIDTHVQFGTYYLFKENKK